MTQLGSTVFINLDRDTAHRTHMEAECAKAGLSPIGAGAKAIAPPGYLSAPTPCSPRAEALTAG